MATTTIKLSTETRDRLKALGRTTYEEAVVEALDLLESNDFWAQADAADAARSELSPQDAQRLAEAEANLDLAITGLG